MSNGVSAAKQFFNNYITMKYLSFFILSASLALAGCGNSHSHDMHGDEHADEAAENGHEHHDGEIEIHAHQAEELGIKVSEVKPAEFTVPIVAAGEVQYNPSSQGVISAPMSGKVSFDKGISAGTSVRRGARIGRVSTSGMAGGDQLQAAKIELEAAQKEVERLAPLREEGIVTAGEYNQAVANLERARNNMSGGAGSVVTAPIDGVISSLAAGEGGFVNAGDVIGMIAGDGGMTLRVDVPVRESGNLKNVSAAKVKFPHIDGTVEASAVSGVNSPSPAPGYVSMYFRLPVMDGIVAGSYAEVYLPTSSVKSVIAVPLAAVTDRMGQKMVYVKERGSDHYRRVPVTIGATDGEMVEVSGLEGGELVVTEGVTFVRLAENSGATPPGHTHNH